MKNKIAKSVVGLLCAGVFFASLSAKDAKMQTVNSSKIAISNQATSNQIEQSTEVQGWYVLFGKDYVAVIK